MDDEDDNVENMGRSSLISDGSDNDEIFLAQRRRGGTVITSGIKANAFKHHIQWHSNSRREDTGSAEPDKFDEQIIQLNW